MIRPAQNRKKKKEDRNRFITLDEHLRSKDETYNLVHAPYNYKMRIVTSDLRAEVDLHDVAVLQHCVVSDVGRVVRRHVVNAASRGKRNARL